SNPLLLGFEEIERLIDRAGKSANEGYPPYNIERIAPVVGAPVVGANGSGQTIAGQSSSDHSNSETAERLPERLRITLAVAGFTRDQLDITLEDKQLSVRGKQQDDQTREYIYRGIAARQFSRTFVLAEGIEVRSAELVNGLLVIDLVRHEPERLVRRIEIGDRRPR
ncbi:MAG: Hsp20 family protein, partial [Hyphomicrobium sp.]